MTKCHLKWLYDTDNFVYLSTNCLINVTFRTCELQRPVSSGAVWSGCGLLAHADLSVSILSMLRTLIVPCDSTVMILSFGANMSRQTV